MTAGPATPAAPRGGVLRRAAANAGMLLGGKSAAGLMQLATFALAARALGVHDFGIFSVLIAQVMLLTGIAAFDSNQAVISYGVGHLNSGNRSAIQSLFKAGMLLDLGAATAAALGTVVAAPFVGRWLGWGPDLILMAQCIAPLSYANAYSTTKGMLRLFGRFDLLTAHAIVTPLLRLALIALLGLLGKPLAWYVGAWLVAGWAGAIVAALFAWREAHRRELLGGMRASWRGLTRDNRGLWRFSIFSNLNSSLALIPTQLAVLIVAGLLGESAAGLFRVAREFGTGIIKPVDLVSQAVYPDIARLVAARSWRRLARVAARAGLAAGAVGAGITLIVAAVGPHLLGALFGPAFVAAAPVLVAVGAGTSLRVLAFAADPVMYAFGRPGTPLVLSIVGSLWFVGAMVWRLPRDGLIGAGWAFIGLGAFGAVASTLFAVRMVRQAAQRDG